MSDLSEELESVDVFSESNIISIKFNFMDELSIVLYLKGEWMKRAINDIKSISLRQSVSFYAKSHCVIGFNTFKGQCPDTYQGHTLLDQLVLITARNYLVAVTKMSRTEQRCIQ